MQETTNNDSRSRRRPWLADRSITTKLALISLVYALIIVILVAMTAGAFEVVQGVRAYVGGEGLWSKGQKDAVYYLTRYTQSRDEADYLRFRQAIAIPLGDHRARIEMQKPDFDYEVAFQGFLEGGNDPEDIPNLIFLFRHFGEFPYFSDAIDIWTEAETHIIQLENVGAAVHAEISAGELTPARAKHFLAEIEKINAQVTPLEHEFSATISDVARIIPRVLFALLFMASVLLLGLALWVSVRISRHLRAAIVKLREGAARVSEGDLDVQVDVLSRDELGNLAEVFNDMIIHRREAAHVLDAERQFLEAVLENLNDGVVACDQNGLLSVFNRATRETHGLPAEPLPAENWAERYDLYLADGKTRMSKEQVPLYRAFEGEVIRDQEMVIAPKDRPLRHVLVNGQPIKSPWGERLGAVCTLHDVTEHKRAEQELMARARDLEQSNAELRRFAYVASHDLQAPLRTVASFSQMLATRYQNQLDEQADEYIRYITSAAASMSEMIHGLLTYSQVNLEHRFEVTDLNALVAQAVDSLKADIAETGAEITLGQLPSLPVIPQQMIQLFQNLIHNAIKFHRDRHPEIRIHAEQGDGEWSVSVEDNGIGIAPEYSGKVFDIFQRLHTDDQFPGSGVGLSLCKQIVTHHGGQIRVESHDHGTVIRFTLPTSPENRTGPDRRPGLPDT